MPRASNGTYTLPGGNPVVTGTTISSTWANTTLSDIGTALTDSLSRSGSGAMTAALQLASGVVGAPGLTWSAETTSGLYRAGSGDFRYSIAAVDKFKIEADVITVYPGGGVGPAIRIENTTPNIELYDTDGTANSRRTRVEQNADIFSIDSVNDAFSLARTLIAGTRVGVAWTTLQLGNTTDNPTYSFLGSGTVTVGGAIREVDGSAATPAYSFSNDTNTGIYRVGSDDLGFAVNGTLVFEISGASGAINRNGQIFNLDGASGAPAYTFTADTDTGIYRISNNVLGFSAGGVRVGIDANGLLLYSTGAGSQRLIYTDENAAGTSSVLIQAGAGSTSFGGGIVLYAAAHATQPGGVWLGHASGGGSIKIGSGGVGPGTEYARFAASQLLLVDGAVGTPAFSFINDTNTGLYRIGADELGIAAGGTLIFDIFSGGAILSSVGRLFVNNDGTAALPVYTFGNDQNTGFYRSAVDEMVWVTGGVNGIILDSGQHARFVDGAVGTPAITFQTDTDTGFYRASANLFRATVGGTDATTWFLNGAVGQTLAQDGSASIPGLGFTQDTDTGFYRDTANQIAIALGGSTAGQIAQGTFTGTLTGFTANPTGTVSYQRIGNHVAVFLTSAGISATSNSTAMTMTGLPAIIQPTNAVEGLCLLTDNGNTNMIGGFTLSGGTITFQLFNTSTVANRVVRDAAAFTNSGTKGLLNQWCIFYRMG